MGELQPFAQMLFHLRQLQRALAKANICAYVLVPDGGWGFWIDRRLLAPAGDLDTAIAALARGALAPRR